MPDSQLFSLPIGYNEFFSAKNTHIFLTALQNPIVDHVGVDHAADQNIVFVLDSVAVPTPVSSGKTRVPKRKL